MNNRTTNLKNNLQNKLTQNKSILLNRHDDF